jgi:Icc-related predicted phosphoesterase
MKCLLVSDLHYALKQFDWTSEQAPQFDVVIIAGDHIDISGHVDGRTQIIVILKYLQRLQGAVRLIVSSGNHDLDGRNASGEKVARWIERVRALGIPTDGESVLIDGTLFTICPWWDGPLGRAQVAAQLESDHGREKQRWIWVYHAPPDASPTSWLGQRHAGDADLAGWIDRFRPDMVLCGHIHESPFAKGGSWVDRIGRTWVFNAGRTIGPTPCHVVFDTERQQALWFSIAGAETVRLDEPLIRPVAELTALPDWLR